MGILSVKEGWRDTTLSGDGQNRSIVRTFSVITDSIDTTAFEVATAQDPASGLRIPQRQESHPANSVYEAGDPSASRVSPCYWNVVCTYTPRGANLELGRWPADDPLSHPADVKWSKASWTEATDVDANGDPIQTAAGEPLDPPPSVEKGDRVLTIARNEAAHDDAQVSQYVDTVNAGTFWGYGAGRGRLLDIAADLVHASISYWRKTYKIRFRVYTPDGVTNEHAWRLRLLNQGYRYLDDAGKVHQFVDAEGRPLQQPKLLAANGTPLASDADPVYLLFVQYPPKDWTALGIGQ